MSLHNYVGKIGEDLAREYLEKRGYKVLEHNYRTKYAEIDLVCEKSAGFLGMGKPILVFVEVRTKIGEDFGAPEETINRAKLRRVRKNALAYAAFKKRKGLLRLDAICIVLKPDFSILRMNHYENLSG